MQKRTREIFALALLVLLGAGLMGVMGWYIVAGHSWNQAATSIDDLVGSMEGYTVIVFDGTAPPPRQLTSGAAVPEAGDDVSGGSDASAAKESSRSTAAVSARRQTAAAVAAEYRSKGAAVVKIDLADLDRYRDPLVVTKGGRRMGLFYLPGTFRFKRDLLKDDLRVLRRRQAGFSICLTRDRRALAADLEGIDLLVLARDARLPQEGDYRGTCLCVDSPAEGSVQAVIVSPSGVLTSRTVGPA